MGLITGLGTIVYSPEKSNFGRNVQIGKRCKIHFPVWFGDNVVIGNDCKIQAFTFIPEGVIIEDNVFIGPHVCFTNDKHPPSQGKSWGKTIVRRGAVIGANASILPGIEIGENATIGAGSVITKNIEANRTVAGNPAKELLAG